MLSNFPYFSVTRNVRARRACVRTYVRVRVCVRASNGRTYAAVDDCVVRITIRMLGIVGRA